MTVGAFETLTLTCNASATAGVYTLGTAVAGLGKYDWFTVDATLGGNGGGAIDVVIMRRVATDDWREWMRFPQVAANTTKRYTAQPQADGTISETTTCADATPPTSFVLAANTNIGGHPGDAVKLCVLAGTGASAAVPQTVKIKAWQRYGSG